ncbi:MAG: hypothetical protein WC224_00215 [Sphaerochaetaceae bacterium]
MIIKKGFLLVLIYALCLLPPLSAGSAEDQNGLKIKLFLDAVALEVLWTKHISIRGGVGASLENGVAFSLPFYFLIDRSGGDEVLMDIGLKLHCYPWKKGPFFSLSLAQFALFIGPYPPEETLHYLSEIGIGYTWEILPYLFIEPEVLYRDPSNTFKESFTYIHDYIPGYQKFQFCLKVGWMSRAIVSVPY